jgi:pectinesterase
VFPGLVFIHGGAWMKGKKTMLRRQAAHMASLGFVAACIEYRLSGEAKFPAALQDAKAAVRWMRANALHYQIDARRIGAVGGSAGGHLAALLGTTQGMKEFEGDGGNAGFPSDVRAVVAFNGVFNLTKMAGSDDSGRGTEAVLAFMGSSYESASERWKAASPVMQVGPKSAPFLLLHGTADNTVPYAQAVEMLDRLKASGVAVELYTADDAKHGFFNSPPYYEPTLKKMEEFFIRTLAVLTR